MSIPCSSPARFQNLITPSSLPPVMIERNLAIDPPASDLTIAPHRMGDFVQQDLPQASSQLRLRATEKLPPITMGLE
jgi:hypothetical protein